jgi:hypothetical protein
MPTAVATTRGSTPLTLLMAFEQRDSKMQVSQLGWMGRKRMDCRDEAAEFGPNSEELDASMAGKTRLPSLVTSDFYQFGTGDQQFLKIMNAALNGDMEGNGICPGLG